MKINLEGARFGRWVVLRMADERKGGQLCWVCRCDCGEEGVVSGSVLRAKKSKSCGCLRREAGVERGKASRKHGESYGGEGETAEYRAWANMLSRCRNSNHAMFADYGGRGISVCERWSTYDNFLADVGRRPSEFHSIDRIDNSGNYEPGNVRWATWQEQNNNRRERGEGRKAKAAMR